MSVGIVSLLSWFSELRGQRCKHVMLGDWAKGAKSWALAPTPRDGERCTLLAAVCHGVGLGPSETFRRVCQDRTACSRRMLLFSDARRWSFPLTSRYAPV